MEFHSDTNKEPSEKRTARTEKASSSAEQTQRKKLGSILKLEKHERTYDDFHPKVLKNFHQKQQVERKCHKSEELVKYMSNLPSYLEKGENRQEKAFNIGVLDWRLLEKWQHNSPQRFPETGIVSSIKGKEKIHHGKALNAQEEVEENGSISVSPSRRKDWKEKASGSSPSNVAGDEFSRLKMKVSESIEANGSNSISPSRRKNLKAKTSDSLPRNIPEDGFSLSKPDISESAKGNGSISVSPSKRKSLKEKKSDPLPRNLAEVEFSQSKMGISESAKVRNPSPNGRFSFSLGRTSKSSSSTVTSAKPSSVSENLPGAKLTSSTSRARTSPLRRLLDPFLKPKGGESHHFPQNPSTINKSQENPASHSVKVKVDLKGCRTVDIGNLRESDRNGSTTMQALLQITVKNGLPLFTFTVDNCSEILAATVKELNSPKKTVPRWVYTFFSFSEMKKKNMHWINQGCKDRNHGFVSNVVAQMNVCEVPSPESNGQRSVTKSTVREFVLSSLGTSNGDQTLTSDELAAIVVKFPEKVIGQANQDRRQQSLTLNKFSTLELKEPLQEARNGSDSTVDLISLSVILPGGDHGVPRKGDPYPLIKRWKTGGACDCGGWDLGCRIRVLANSNQSSLRFNSTRSQETAFKLFSEEEADEKKPMFLLSPFEDEIFSVEFSSSLKLIQAFAIGIAILNSKATAGSSKNVFEGKISEVITLSKDAEVPAKYFSYPPVSPVGRV